MKLLIIKLLNATFAEKVIIAITGFLVSFFADIWIFILVAMFFVLVDLVLGRRAARARGEVVKSFMMRRTVEKLVLYSMAIIVSEALRQAFFVYNIKPEWVEYTSMAPITYITAIVISWTEWKSIIENIEDILDIEIKGEILDRLPKFKKKDGAG